MRRRITAFAAFAFLLVTPAGARGGEDQQHSGPSRKGAAATERVAAPFALDRASYENLKDRQVLTLSNVALDGDLVVRLELERFDVLADDAIFVTGTAVGDVPAERPKVALFRGDIGGDDGSSVFLSVSPYGVHGIIQSNHGAWVISSGPCEAMLQPVIYDLATAPEDAFNWAPFKCDTVQAPVLAPPPSVGATDARDAPLTRCLLVRVAVDTDWEFTGNLFGGDVNASSAYAATLIGAVSYIYWRDFRVELEISYLRTWADSADPWDQPDTGAQLVQFREYWQGMGNVDRDVAHFLSGRPLGGGMAYAGGVLCSYGWGFGLSANLGGGFPYPLQHNRPNNWDPYVVAHEIGHNFAAPHTHEMTPPVDGCGLGDCTDANLGTIMSYCHTCAGGMNNIRLEFHPRIIDETVMPYLASVGDCLASAEPEFSVQPTPSQTVCPGEWVVLSVVTDAILPSYQWRRGETGLADGANLIGTNSSNLLIVSAAAADSADDYNCVVSDWVFGCDGVSDYAEIIVDPWDAVITQQPADQTVAVDSLITLSIMLEYPMFHTYQWRKDGAALVDDGHASGSGSTTLYVFPTQVADAGSYDCEISGLLGAHCTVMSDAANVTVEPASQCSGDLDSDGDVDLSDLSTLLANYGATNGAALEDGDSDGDGDVDLADLSALLADYGRSDC